MSLVVSASACACNCDRSSTNEVRDKGCSEGSNSIKAWVRLRGQQDDGTSTVLVQICFKCARYILLHMFVCVRVKLRLPCARTLQQGRVTMVWQLLYVWHAAYSDFSRLKLKWKREELLGDIISDDNHTPIANENAIDVRIRSCFVSPFNGISTMISYRCTYTGTGPYAIREFEQNHMCNTVVMHMHMIQRFITNWMECFGHDIQCVIDTSQTADHNVNVHKLTCGLQDQSCGHPATSAHKQCTQNRDTAIECPVREALPLFESCLPSWTSDPKHPKLVRGRQSH